MKGFMNQSTVEINVELTYNFVHNDQRMNIVITVCYGGFATFKKSQISKYPVIYFVWIWNFILLTGMTKATGPAKLQMNVSEISIQQLKFLKNIWDLIIRFIFKKNKLQYNIM